MRQRTKISGPSTKRTLGGNSPGGLGRFLLCRVSILSIGSSKSIQFAFMIDRTDTMDDAAE